MNPFNRARRNYRTAITLRISHKLPVFVNPVTRPEPVAAHPAELPRVLLYRQMDVSHARLIVKRIPLIHRSVHRCPIAVTPIPPL